MKLYIVNNLNSMNSKYPINASPMLGFGTKISDDDQKILIRKFIFLKFSGNSWQFLVKQKAACC